MKAKLIQSIYFTQYCHIHRIRNETVKNGHYVNAIIGC